MKKIKAMILTGYGLNCDNETAYALQKAGTYPQIVHINSFINGDVDITDFNILVFIGGFSWADDHGAGVIEAVHIKTKAGDKLLNFIENGNAVLGICNGFQTIVNLGLLPGFDGDYTKRLAAMTFNDCGSFRDQWIFLKADPESKCIFTKGLGKIELPIRHGEGKFFSDEETIKKLTANKQIALKYALPDGSPAQGEFPYNPNGSVSDIAGICDTTGRIFGLMPHPEAYNHWTNHPDWTRMKEKKDTTAGIMMFKNAVSYFR